MKRLGIITILLLINAALFFGITAEEIVNKLDDNEVYNTIRYDGEMIINISGKRLVKSFTGYAKGNKNFFMEFTNSDDQGTRYMKKEGNLFVYTEELEEVMPITGHMLRESMMGSDLSYEDAVENDTLISQYHVKIVEETTFKEDTPFKGNEVWVLELTAKRKTVSYPKRKIWVDKKTFAALKTELYALSGAKLKEMTLLGAEWIDGKYFPTEYNMDDLLRKDSYTIFKMMNVKLNVDISDSMFSLRRLEG